MKPMAGKQAMAAPSRRISRALALLLAAAGLLAGYRPAPAQVVALDRFLDASAWHPRDDGGHPPQYESVPAPGGRVGNALHLIYRDQDPHWGNLERPISLPSGRGTVSAWIYRRHAGPAACLHLFLIEPDGDLWVARLEDDGLILGQWHSGWHRVQVALEDMDYLPRGNGVKERAQASLLALGCNYADLEVFVADLTFESPVQPAPGWEESEQGLVRHARLELGQDDPAVAGHLGPGWWAAEPDGRWTGRDGQPALLRLPAWPGYDYLVSLYVTGGPQGWQQQGLPRASLAGKPLPTYPGPREQERWLLIPAGLVQGSRLEIRLDSPTWQPGGPDPRTLGAKVRLAEAWAVRRSPLAGRLAGAAGRSFGLFVPPGRSPTRTARVLASWGYRVMLLGPEEVANPALLTPERFWCLGVMDDQFPACAQEALIHYLARGGHLAAFQGYALDRPLSLQEGKWCSLRGKVRLNTHYGEAHDALALGREQVGAFDPSYPLDQAAGLRAAPDQVISGPVAIPGRFSGWAASALVGSNNPVFPQVWGRRLPVLEAHDRTGRALGAAVSLVHHWAGPWAGSSWLLCGVENRNLLLEPKAAAVLHRALGALQDQVYLRSLAPGLACYRPGEQPQVSFTIHNGSPRPLRLQWRLVAHAGSTGQPTASLQGEARLSAGQSLPVTAKLALPGAESFYRVTCTLSEGKLDLDQAATGLCLWQPARLAAGPALGFAGNYFTCAGRPTFLAGTNQTGIMFGSALEDPLVWRRDLQAMADHGLNVLRILHFSAFAMPPQARVEPEVALRQLDAIVQLAQEAGVIVFLSLHDWLPVELSPADLAAQRAWARQVAERYRGVPGVLYDVQNEPSVNPERAPDAGPLWTQFLRERYGSDQALAAAWGEPGVTLEGAELSRGREEWAAARNADFDRFRAWLLNRWAAENIAGVKDACPQVPCTVGYLPWPAPADQVLGGAHLDFANMHYYGPLDRFPSHFKWTDQRALGRSLSLGEFGVKAHPAWHKGNEVGLTEREGVTRLLDIVHYALGLGASLVANWDWKDMPECVFPWGLNHPGDLVPKDFLLAYRNLSLLTRPWAPAYQDPGLYLLLADEHRLGAARERVTAAQQAAVDLLLACQVSFNVINDGSLDRLPASARALVYPIPYCPDDAVIARLERFVREGGRLYLSGDLCFAPDRRRTRTDRLQRLCGVRFRRALAEPLEEGPETRCQGEGIPAYDAHPVLEVEPAGAQVLGQSPRTGGVLFRYRLGQGEVVFSTDPVELHPQQGGAAVYRAFLELAGIPPVAAGLPAGVHAFSLPAADGGALYLARNPGSQPVELTFSHASGRVSLFAAAGGWALALFGPQGQVRALEGTGSIRLGDAPLLEAGAPVMALAPDDTGLQPGRSLVLMPLDTGELLLPWRAEAAQVGEFHRLHWQPREQFAPSPSGSGCRLLVDEQRRLQPMIVGREQELAPAARGLEAALALPGKPR